MKIVNQSFTVRLAIVMTALIAVTLFLTIYLTVSSIEKSLSDQIGESFELQANNLSNLIELFLEEEVEHLLVLAESNLIQETVQARNASYEGQPEEILAQIEVLNQTWIDAKEDHSLIMSIVQPDPAENPIPDELRIFLDTFEAQTEIFVTDRHGATVGASARLSDYEQADESWWQAAWQDGEGAIYISSPKFDRSAGITALLIGVPIFATDHSEPIGVLRSTLNIDALLDLIATQRLGTTGQAILVDSQTGFVLNSQEKYLGNGALFEVMQSILPEESSGYFTYHPKSGEINGSINDIVSISAGTNATADAADSVTDTSTAGSTGNNSGDDTDLLIGYTIVHQEVARSEPGTLSYQLKEGINKLNWLIVVRQEAGEAFASIQAIFWQGGLVGLAAISLAGLAALLLTRTVTRPLIMLSEAAEAIGQGNLETPLPAPREDEIGDLTRSFANMQNRLGQLINSLKEQTTELSETNETLASEITERKQTEKALQEERNLLQTLMDTLPDYIYIKDTMSRFININAAHLQSLGGKSQDDVVGKTDFDFAPSELANQYFAEEQALIQSGQPLLNHIEAVRWQAEGEIEKWMLTTKIPLRGEDGAVTGLMGISRDITVMKDRESELEEAKKGAESATRSKSQFLANMSHEIRTPMNAVIGMTSLLLDTPLNGEQQDFVETIHMSGNALLTIVNDILDFSKLESGQFELEARSFDLTQSVKGAIDLFQAEAAQKELALSCHLEADVPHIILGDATRLRQILVNLLSNAIKFTKKGKVALNVAKQDEKMSDALLHLTTLEFSVSDTGIGISQDHQDRLFNSATQNELSTTEQYGGKGLGLAISKQLCEMMGGTMRVESKAGHGSTFYFTITVQTVTSANGSSTEYYSKMHRPETQAEFTEIAHTHPLRILLTEDDAVNQKVAISILTRLGYRADIAENGREAVESIHRQAYDVILMDIHMPEVNGLAATKMIRKQIPLGAQPYIIATTADAMQGDREKCLEAGMNDYVSKPIRVDELSDALRRVPIRHN